MGSGKVTLVFMALFLMTFSAAVTQGQRLRQDKPCSEQGFFRDEKDCTKFYRCAELPLSYANEITRYEFNCPLGTIFDESISTCNHVSQVQNPPGDCNVEPVVFPPVDQQGQNQDGAGAGVANRQVLRAPGSPVTYYPYSNIYYQHLPQHHAQVPSLYQQQFLNLH